MARDRGGAVATSTQSSEATVTQRMRVPTNGPHDGDTADPQITPAPGTMDFGAVKVPVPAEGTVVVESSSEGRIQAVHVSVPEGRLSVSALAAPRTGGLWPDLADEIHASLREGGARVRSFTGQWGRELHATSQGATSLFVGVDGPRWMLYGVATGPTRDAVALDARLRRMLRGTVVVRGRAPYPVRTVLPLVTPPELGGEEQPTASAPPTMTLRTAAANGVAPPTAIPTNGTPLKGVATGGSAPNGMAIGGAAARGAAATGATANGPAATGGAPNGASVNGNGTASRGTGVSGGGPHGAVARSAASGGTASGGAASGGAASGVANGAATHGTGGNGAVPDRRPHTNGAAWADGRPGRGSSPRDAAGGGAFPTGALPYGAGPAGTTNGAAPAGAASGVFPAGPVPNGAPWQGAPLTGATQADGYPAGPAAYDTPPHGGSTSGGFPTGAPGATTPYDAPASGGFGAGAPPYGPPTGGQGHSGATPEDLGPVDRPDGGRSTGPRAASSGSFPRRNVPTGWAHATGTPRRWTDVPAPQAWSEPQPSRNGQAPPVPPSSSLSSSPPTPWASPSPPSLSPPPPAPPSQQPQYPSPSPSPSPPSPPSPSPSLPSLPSPAEGPSPQPTSPWSAARHPDVDAAPPDPPRTRGEGAYRASEPEPTAQWRPEWAEPATRTPDQDAPAPSDMRSATARWDPLVDPLPGGLDPLPDPDPAWRGPLAGDPPAPADRPARESYGRLDRPIGGPDHLAAERQARRDRPDPREWSADPTRRQGRRATPTVSGTTAHSHAAASYPPAPTPSDDGVAAPRTGRRRASEPVDDGRHSAAQPPRRRRDEAAAHHADVASRHAAPTRVPPTQWAWPKQPAPETAESDAQAGRRAADGARPAAWSAADLLDVGRHGGGRRHGNEPPRHGAPDDTEAGRHHRP